MPESAPERTPPDDTTLEGVEQFADESREFAEASLPLAAEILPDDTTPPVPADGPVLCRCGNPDNCSCPPVERTVRLVIENAAPLGPARTITLDGHRYTVLRYEAPDLGMTETYELRQRPTALAGDPGDLPARMTEAMRVALVTWSEGTQHEHLANAALSVRDELVAHLAARVGDAEHRAEHAESEHQVTQDRLAEARAERDTLKAADKRVRCAIASFEWTVVGKLVSAALDAPETREETDRG